MNRLIPILSMIMLSSCDSFVGGNSSSGGGGAGFNGDQNKNPTNGTSTGQTGTSTGISGNGDPNVPEGWGGLRKDVAVDYGTDNQSLYVDAQATLSGEYAGDDAKFKFFVQRISPAIQRDMTPMVEARGAKQSDSGTVAKLCRCGQKSTIWFFWQHTASMRPGALHNKGYDVDNRLQGDWIVASNVSDSKWLSPSLKAIPQGPASLFFGADTENPAVLFKMNLSGFGYFRTWYYHPNSGPLFATKEHRWDSRDDIRIGLTCNISQCPADLQSSTSIEVVHHRSHEASWRLP